MATSETVTLSDALDMVHVTPGQASKVLYALAADLADSDPELRSAFIAAADAVVAPPEPPAKTTSSRTGSSATTTVIGKTSETTV